MPKKSGEVLLALVFRYDMDSPYESSHTKLDVRERLLHPSRSDS